MKNLKILLLLFFPIVANSQQFQWGYPFPIEDETEAKINYLFDDDGLFRLYSKYDMAKFNHNINVLKFSKVDFEKLGSQNLGVTQPPMGLNSLTHINLFEKNKGNFTFFLYDIDRSTKVNSLFWQEVSIKNGKKSDLNKVTSISGESVSNSGNFYISQSENKNYFAVLKELPFVKKANEKIEILVLNQEKNIVSNKEFFFPYLDDRNKQNKVYIANNGNICLVKEVDLPKQKPFKMLYFWNISTNIWKEFEIKLENDYQIHQFDVDFENNNLYFTGLTTSEGSTSIALKVDFSGNASGVRSNGLIAIKIDENGNELFRKTNNFKSIINNVRVKDILIKDEKIWLLADQMYTTKKSTVSQVGQFNFQYDYTYQNNGYFFGMVSMENGLLEWYKEIPNQEPNTINDNGEYLSCLYFFKDNTLGLLYNDTREVNSGKISSYFKKFPVIETYDFNGNRLQKNDLLAAGIGVQKNEKFDLDTSVLFEVGENLYIIRAKSGVEYKYGLLKL